jgi:uncharacterized protein (DUF608 family)
MFVMPNLIEGTYRTERGLLLSRSGLDPMSGEVCIAFASEFSVFSMVSSTVEDLWNTFEKAEAFEGRPAMGLSEYGALATRFVIEPGVSRAVSVVLSWHFPNRIHAGQTVGNQYTRQSRTATEVSDRVIRGLPDVWRSLRTWQQLCTENSLPEASQQALQNSLAQHYKTTFITSEGQWAAWDSLSNPELSSAAAQLYRVLPQLYFTPDAVQNHLRTLATLQDAAGRFPLVLGEGSRFPIGAAPPSSHPVSAPVFFILAFLPFRHTGQRAFMQELWPHIVKALSWQSTITTPEGLPSNLPVLGNWESMAKEGVALSDALFQIAGLSAVLYIASAIDRSIDVKDLSAWIGRGIRTVETRFWTGSGYRTRWSPLFRSNDAADAADLAGMSALYLVEAGDLFDQERVLRHLDALKAASALTLPDGAAGDRDRTISMNVKLSTASVLNWAAVNLWAGGPAEESLDLVERFYTHQRDVLQDPWNLFETFSTQDGIPWSNPHHVSHLGIWLVTSALSGQQYDASNRRLAFAPRLLGRARYPFFTPEANGILHEVRSGNYEVQVLSGRLQLNEIAIGEALRFRDVALETGQVLQLRS